MSLPTWEEKEGQPGGQAHPQLSNPAWVNENLSQKHKTKFNLNRQTIMLYMQTCYINKMFGSVNNTIIMISNPRCFIFLACTVSTRAELHYSKTTKGQNSSCVTRLDFVQRNTGSESRAKHVLQAMVLSHGLYPD